MPVYFRPRVGPFVYAPSRRRRRVRPDSPLMERVKVAAALVITVVCAAVLVAIIVAAL